MTEIKKIDPASVAKIAALFGVIWGFIVGLLVLLMGAATSQFTGRFYMGFERAFPLVIGAAAIVLLPILYGIVGYVGGFVTAYIYNFIAEKVGGVKIEFK